MVLEVKLTEAVSVTSASFRTFFVNKEAKQSIRFTEADENESYTRKDIPFCSTLDFDESRQQQPTKKRKQATKTKRRTSSSQALTTSSIPRLLGSSTKKKL